MAVRKSEKTTSNTTRRKRTGGGKTKIASSQKTTLLIGGVVGVLILLFLAISSITMYAGDRALAKNGVTVLGINVGGKNAAQIEALLNMKAPYKNFSAEFTCGDITQKITAQDVSLKLDVEKTAAAAVAHGRENIFSAFSSLFTSKEITPVYTYDQLALSDISVAFSEKCGGSLKQHHVTIEDAKIVIKAGTAGSGIDLDELKKAFEKAVKNGGGSYDLQIDETQPAPIDIDELYASVYCEPTDAHYTIEGKEVTIQPETNGKSFNKEAAKRSLSGFKAGSKDVTIPLDITPAAVKAEDISKTLFADVLGKGYSEYQTSNRNRSTNVELAAKYVDGTILLPGDEFSYNGVVGKRTYDRGFKAASVYENNKMVDGLGGGICQTSSTIYAAVLYADLEVTERHEHSLEVHYVDLGTDATVAYGSLDFRFKNNTKAPIKISAKASGGKVNVEILGTKENPNKTVEIVTKFVNRIPYSTTIIEDASLEPGTKIIESTGFNGATVETYKIIKVNGEQISNTLVHTSRYTVAPRVERVGPAVVEEVPPTDGTTPAPETPPTEGGDVVIEGDSNTAAEIYDELALPDGI